MTDRSEIARWLEQAGVSFEEVELQADTPADWAIITEAKPYQVFVAEPSKFDTGLRMELQLGVSDEHRESLAKLAKDDLDRFLFDLRLALLERPVGFNIVRPSEEALPAAVRFAINVLEDPLTKAGFFRRHHQLQTAAMFAATMFQKMHRFHSWP